jgi:sigma-B regulation protein RsbU (phosphoserine phosphatase)
MYSNFDDGKFVTFFYGLLDVEGRRFVYTNAGHNQPILVREDGCLERLETGGTVCWAFWKTAAIIKAK